MTPVRRAAWIASVLALAHGLGPARRATTEPQIANQIAVRRIEVAQRLDAPLSVRLRLATGQALNFEVREPLQVQSLLVMAQAFASRGAHLFAEVENNRVRGVREVPISVP